MLLEGKVAVITGSGNGIGEAFARRFAAEGARVVVTDIEDDATQRVAADLGAVGVAADVTREEDVRRVAERAREAYGPIDVWFSNAGWSGPRQPADLQDDATWDRSWRLHVLAHLYAARAVLPEMVERGAGYLLNTASSVALVTQPEKVAYSVTKHGGLALAEWLAVHYRPKGVRVSCFCPGPMLTRMLLSNDFPEDSPVLQEAPTPEQVAEIVLRGIEKEDFLILTTDAPLTTFRQKGVDYDAWIASAGAPLP
ncbi:MAG TPA: SDR family oxidoreductase [Amycolatopsis sp.]|nr:SDR family oxidoreductase [Amycolatopsis sp.]